jgi:dihydrofolate synthase/folylpolyglutamate synthase
VRARLSLAGEHQVTNALAAIAALEALGVEPRAIELGLREARWPGRLEAIAQQPLTLLDGAHNPGGARALARYLEQHHAGRRVWLIYAAMRDKAVEEVAEILFPAAHQVLLTRVAQPRAVAPDQLAAIVGHLHPRVEVTASLAEALATARSRAAADDLILITGSLYLVGEAKAS